MRTLYVSDLDGTLLQPDATLSGNARDAIHELLDRDVLFTLASARSAVSMRELLGPLPIALPTVGFNGGTISNWQTGETLRRASMASDVARHIVGVAQREGLSPFVSTSGQTDRLSYVNSINGGMDWFIDERNRAGDARLGQVDSLDPVLSDEVLCTTIIGEFELLTRLRDEIFEAIGESARPQLYRNPYGPDWDWLTFNGPKATKAHGIDGLIELAELDPETNVVVFGDALNDLEMFARADHAVAPANAHPELLAAADEVIGANATDAVVGWLMANT